MSRTSVASRNNPFRVKLLAVQNYDGQLLPALIDTRYNEWIEPLGTMWAWEAWHQWKFNTVKSYLHDVALFYWWNDQQDIDLNMRLSSLRLYAKAELHALTSFVSETRHRRGGAAGESAVHRTTFNRRLTAITSFVKTTTDFYLDLVYDPLKSAALEKRIDRALKYLRKQAYGHADDRSVKSVALDAELLARLRDIIAPEQPNNPYRGVLAQWRNCALIYTLLETGARRGEIVRLTLADLELDTCEPTITLRKQAPAVAFPRREKPSMKTRGRVLPISLALRDLLQSYVHDIRPRLRKSRGRYPHVFLNTVDGLPITGHGIYQLLNRIARVDPRFEGRLRPHDLRVTAQTLIREALDAAPSSSNRLVEQGVTRDIMTYVGGWSARSAMVDHYTEAAIRKRLEAITRKDVVRGERR